MLQNGGMVNGAMNGAQMSPMLAGMTQAILDEANNQ